MKHYLIRETENGTIVSFLEVNKIAKAKEQTEEEIKNQVTPEIEYIYPEVDGTTVDIEDEQNIYLGFSTFKDDVFIENKEMYDSYLDKQLKKIAIKKEMQEIIDWLSSKDYMVNKYNLHEYTDTDERWIEYLAERKIKLARYNELEKL